MILGHVRDNFPRVTLSLPGAFGPVSVEFIVDTGFDGELALPGALVRDLERVYAGDRPIQLADGSERARPAFQISLAWDEEEDRPTEVLVLDGVPLLGVNLLEGSLLQAEMTSGGQVQIEPL